MENNLGPQPSLASVSQQNRQVLEEILQLKHTVEEKQEIIVPYEANEHALAITRLQERYKGYLAEKEELAYLDEEGVIEVTIRSRRKTLALPVCVATGKLVSEALLAEAFRNLRQVSDEILLARQVFAGDGVNDSYNNRMQALLLDPVPLVVFVGNPVDQS